ncbi:serine/threonine protein kinase [Actinomadura sp. 21ATH]|uniref:serine/threonine protein kinase n=1 Tax=Actinomadura sp. 21ATH TaxID=1735444 RepID=UPI0035C20144
MPGYRDLSILHRGASAVVYRAVHEESGAVVALRVRRGGGDPAPDESAALVRASRDEHLVTVRETGRTASGRAYAALEFCGGGTYVPAGPLPAREAVGAAAAAGKGLLALHAEGLVHGDVHPGRLFRGGGGALLSGAAALRGLDTGDLERIDAGHAAPEILRRGAPTAAADVYGLAATLWTLLAGHPPYAGDDPWAVRQRALTGPVPPLPRGGLPERLRDAMAAAMSAEPAERPSAAAFTAALDEVLREMPETAVAAPRPERAVWEELPGWSWEADAPRPEPAPARAGTAREGAGGRAGKLRPARRLGGVVAAAVALAVVGAGIGVAALLSGPGTAPEAPRAEPGTPVVTSTPTAVRNVEEYVPGRVRIVDARVTIEVSWQDRSAGRAAYYVVGGPDGQPASTLATAPAGSEKVVVTALNPSVDYCLTVVAVADVDRVAHAEPVCTRRVKRSD